MKFKATIEVEYEVSYEVMESYYDSRDPKQVAKIDEKNLNHLESLIEFLDERADYYSVKVEPVK